MLLALLVASLTPSGQVAPSARTADPHSFARPDQAVVTHLSLDVAVDFDARRLSGRAVLDVEGDGPELVLDTSGLEILGVSLGPDATPADYTLGDAQPFLGRPLRIRLAPGTTRVNVDYATGPDAGALQWLTPEQTAGKRHPFLFTQSQAIQARSWVPIQDSPGIRFTYEASVRVPRPLRALMSAENSRTASADGVYRFSMPQPIPAYLLALAVGDLDFRALDDRVGVWAEPSVVDAAAWEFADTPKYMQAAESLYGPYRWGRYDVLVLPPSFPFGGMENPRLTFVTPALLAGDRSQASVIAHELAHSWSGNLVTSATWNDFWLNEGFTRYIEQRLMEAVHGPDHSDMLWVLSRRNLDRSLALFADDPDMTRLRTHLEGRDPDDAANGIPYEKGAHFLRRLETIVGRERFDAFLRGYFDAHAFGSMDTATFQAYLERHLLAGHPDWQAEAHVARWLDEPGVPEDCPRVTSKRFDAVDAQVAALVSGAAPGALATGGWTSQEWLRFIGTLPGDLPPARLAELDAAFGLSDSGNSEIAAEWLRRAVVAGYEPAYPAVERFLQRYGRRKYLEPIYRALAATPAGLERARAIYTKARPGYHPLAQRSLDELLNP